GKGIMEEKKDVFDRLFSIKPFCIIQPFYRKYKEQLLYLFFGGCTFFIALITFSIGVFSFGLEEITSNNISWIIAVAFAYITNRTWVFTEKSHTFKGIVREIISFAAGRLLTLFMENGIIWLFIDVLGIGVILTKVVGQIVVIVTNYFLSKFIIFKKDK
ncbi:MAG: GtrA family protein, partial [Oscillospiraceae bacterium]|nr:GtrA family protein [Oscillospiraceae bacterium]